MTVSIHVLAQQGHLSCPSFHQALDLLCNLDRALTALTAPPQADNAIGAQVIAAVHHRDVAGYRMLDAGGWLPVISRAIMAGNKINQGFGVGRPDE